MTATLSTRDALLQCAGWRVTGERPTCLPILGRDALPALCRELGFTRGAEIGVWKGSYSAKFCQANPLMHMLCVDPWRSYPEWVDTKNATKDPHAFMAAAYREACARLAPLNCTIKRACSSEAAADVPDGSLDLVFIDGNHSLDAVTEDLTLWAPKVRSGGIVSGHDFRVFSNKPFIHVVEAVTAFTQAHQIDPWFVLSGDKTPSWLWVVA